MVELRQSRLNKCERFKGGKDLMQIWSGLRFFFKIELFCNANWGLFIKRESHGSFVNRENLVKK